jgi:hypothetical protein
MLADVVNQSNQETFEFQLDDLPLQKCRELERYVNE